PARQRRSNQHLGILVPSVRPYESRHRTRQDVAVDEAKVPAARRRHRRRRTNAIEQFERLVGARRLLWKRLVKRRQRGHSLRHRGDRTVNDLSLIGRRRLGGAFQKAGSFVSGHFVFLVAGDLSITGVEITTWSVA